MKKVKNGVLLAIIFVVMGIIGNFLSKPASVNRLEVNNLNTQMNVGASQKWYCGDRSYLSIEDGKYLEDIDLTVSNDNLEIEKHEGFGYPDYYEITAIKPGDTSILITGTIDGEIYLDQKTIVVKGGK